MYIFSVNFWIPILYTAYRFGDMEIVALYYMKSSLTTHLCLEKQLFTHVFV